MTENQDSRKSCCINGGGSRKMYGTCRAKSVLSFVKASVGLKRKSNETKLKCSKIKLRSSEKKKKKLSCVAII